MTNRPPAGTCSLHDQLAVGVCQRCGAFVCVGCEAPSPEGYRCPACRELAAPMEARARQAQFLARASWMSFVSAVVLAIALPTHDLSAVGVLLPGILCLLGFGAGIAAVFRRRGTSAPKVIAPAFIGIILNAIVLLIFLLALVASFVFSFRP